MSWLWSVTGAVALGYAVVVVLMYFTQERMVFLPTRELETTPARYGFPYEDIQLQTANGERLHGWLVPAQQPRGTLLFFHGNAGNISHRMDSIQIFHALQLNVLIIDYRGYGRSEGKPSEHGLVIDAETAWDYLTVERGVPPKSIVLFGRSLGGGPAVALASRVRPAAVILESTFTSIPDLGRYHYPWLPVKSLSRIRFENLALIPFIEAPVLVVHSPDDEIVPYAHGKALLAASPNPRSAMLTISGSHNDGFVDSGLRYTDGLRAFLDEVLALIPFHGAGTSDPDAGRSGNTPGTN